MCFNVKQKVSIIHKHPLHIAVNVNYIDQEILISGHYILLFMMTQENTKSCKKKRKKCVKCTFQQKNRLQKKEYNNQIIIIGLQFIICEHLSKCQKITEPSSQTAQDCKTNKKIFKQKNFNKKNPKEPRKLSLICSSRPYL